MSLVLLLSGVAAALPAQEQWTGVGAIGATAMYMDTTTIIRAGSIRKVWIKSLDSTPKSFVTGKDTLTFDTVIGLNVFDCARHTRTVQAVQYLLGDDIVLDVPENAADIAFGFMLQGKGEIWASDFHFETVGNDVPITGMGALNPKPVNLDFSR